MPTFNFNGKSVHYAEQGSGRPVLLVHASAPIGHALWSKSAGTLCLSFKCVMPDLLAFGASDDWTDSTPLGHDVQGALLTALIEAVVDEPVHLVGHSYGGASAIVAALRAPTLVRSLTLIEPLVMPLLRNGRDNALFEAYRSMAEAFLEHAHAGREDKAWELFVEYWNGPGAWEKMSDRARSRMQAMTANGIAIFPGNINNPTTAADLERISAPTQVVCGGATEPTNVRVAEIVRDSIPNCRFVEIPDAGHMSVLSHPDEISELVRQFITSIDQAEG